MSAIIKQRILNIPGLFMGVLLVVLSGYFVVFKQLAQAANPQLISFQGKVVNADGTNVTNGSYNFDFVLYDDATLGSPSDGVHDKWHELTKSVTVTNGVFQTNLGSATALPDFNANPTLYLAVRFNADAAGYMSPRVRMTSVPYALNSDTVGGLAATSFANTALSNLSSVAINTALLPGADNTIDLGSSAFSFRTLYGDTSILSPAVDVAAAGTLSLGATTANAITLGKTGITTTIPGIVDIQGTGTALALSGASTTAISISNTGVTTDISLQNGETIDNNTNGTIQLTATNTAVSGTLSVGTASATGSLTVLSAAGVSTREKLAEFSVSDDSGSLFAINNGTFVDGNFIPSLTGYNSTSASRQAMYINGEITSAVDSGTVPVSSFISRTVSGDYLNGTYGLVGTRPLFSWQNNNTIIAQAGASGQFTFTNSSNSATAFNVQNSSAANILTVDTSNAEVELGSASLSGKLVVSDGSSNTVTITASGVGSDYSLTLPTAAGSTSQCLQTDSVTASQLVFSSCGGSGSTLQGAYDAGSAGDQTITLDSTQDSIIISNPSSAGSDSTFIFKVEQLNTGATKTGLYVDNRGTGNSFQVDDISSDTTPFIVDADGRVGIGTSSVTGTTERLLQVGSVTNRGNAAVFGELVSKGIMQLQALTGINDVFIYDTSLDSDGGRWIDWSDTERLSWATEALDDGASDPCSISTDDRCYSQSFPRKAILVVTANSLYIFDSTTGTMWMRFIQDDAGWALGANSNNNPTSVTAVNGVIYVGTKGTAAGGLYAFDFVNDRMWNYDDTDRSGADVGIGSRNGVVSYSSDNNTNFDLGSNTGWKTINDVSSTVIQNSKTIISTTSAPNNAITVVGLATDSGLTVINLSTQKIRQYSDQTDQEYEAVAVTRNARLYGLNSSIDQLELWINIDVDNVATRINGTPDKVVDETTAPRLSKATPVVNTNSPDALEVITNGSLADAGILATAAIPSNSDLIYVGTDQGLTEIHLANYTNATTFSGWSKFYTTSRQTAMMPGTIRRMLTMDNASGDVTNAAQSSIMEAKGTPTYNVDGVRNRAMSFNGTSQYLCSDANNDATCDNDTTDNINTGGFTITAWFKHSTTLAGTDVLFARCYNTTPAAATGCLAAAMNSSGQIVTTVDDDALWSIGAATNNDVTYTSTNSYADNQWHFYSLSKYTGAVAPVVLIDGQVISYATSLTHTTLDNAQILGVGTDCSSGAACGTGGNFWDGSIDDFTYSACGTAGCTTDGLGTTSANAAYVARLLFNDARSTLNKKVYDGAADTTSYTSTVITDSSSPAWIPNEFAGMIVRINSGGGAGQTRRITSNTASTITVNPAFSTTPASNDDFKVDPESLIGSSNNVKAIGVSRSVTFGESRVMCAGTNNTTDGGAVTCFNHQSGPNIIADTYHGDTEYTDDSGTEWTGTDYDDIQSIDLTQRTLIIGSDAHKWLESQDVRLGNALDYLQGRFDDIRSQIQVMGSSTLAGQIGLGVGLTGGVDLAEYYTSNQELLSGEIVTLEPNNVGSVKRTTLRYEKGMVGIVATAPGAILGSNEGQSYPIALVGRVPVKITTENGDIKSGDRITSSSIPGYGMKAVKGGQVVGEALEDLTEDKLIDCPENTPEGVSCGVITVFVNLTDYNGDNIELATAQAEDSGLLWGDSFLTPTEGLLVLDGQLSDELAVTKKAQLEKSDKILRYLAGRTDQDDSEVLAGRVSTTELNGANVYAGSIYAGTLVVDKLKANQIEGLNVFTDSISSLSEKYDALLSRPDYGIDEPNDQIASAINLTNFAVRSMSVGQDMNVNGRLYANGGLIVSGDTEFHGSALFQNLVTFIEKTVFNNDVLFAGHITTSGEAPVVEVGVAAGDDQTDVAYKSDLNSPRIMVDGNDTAGQIELSTESGSTIGELLSLQFNRAFDKTPTVIITAANDQATSVSFYVEATRSGFKLYVTDAPSEGATLKFNYWVVQ